jgi:replicative DNA helicase
METRIPTLLVSLDLARLEVINRILGSLGKIDANWFRDGFLSHEDHEKLAEAKGRMKDTPFFVDDTPNRTVADIAACARHMKRSENLGLLMVDDLQLILPNDPQDQRQRQLSQILHSLKLLACELKIPIVCLSQLDRQTGSGQKNARPRLRDLCESGIAERDVDVVLFLHREKQLIRNHRLLQAIANTIAFLRENEYSWAYARMVRGVSKNQ